MTTNNLATITGNLTRDPVVFPLKDGSGILARFSVAIDRPESRSSDYIDCVAFGEFADQVDKQVAKGTQVTVSGPIHSGSYVDKNGIKRYPIEIAVDALEVIARGRILDPTEVPAEVPAEASAGKTAKPRAKAAAAATADDIPF